MFFHRIQHPGRRLWAAGTVFDDVRGSILIREGSRPPQVVPVLADPGFDDIRRLERILARADRDPAPGDGDFIARAAGFGLGYYKNRQEAFVGLSALRTIEPEASVTEATKEAYGNWKLALEKSL